MSGQQKETLARTGRLFPFENLGGALKAVHEYLAGWPDSPEARDVRLARQCIAFLINVMIPSSRAPIYEDQTTLAETMAGHVPLLLSNGLATAGRVSRPQKAKRFLDWMAEAHRMCASLVDPLHEEADKEARSLLVDGKTRSEIDGLTEQYFADAAVPHFAAFDAGNLDAAYAGFSSLKELDPYGPGLRSMLGAILGRQGKYVPALRELLYGFSRDPTHVLLVRDTMATLCGFSFYPAVIEVARHFTTLGGDPNDPSIRPWIALARACSAATCVRCVQCEPEDLSEQAADLLDEVDVPEHPWLPARLLKVSDVLAHKSVFLSYRRAGGVELARRLQRALKDEFASMHVYLDVVSSRPGWDFVDQISGEVATADVFLALVDRDWKGPRGRRSRLDDPEDILRREVARALKRNAVVIPVLLEGARMPADKDLPDDLRSFARLQAVTLSANEFEREFFLLSGEMARLLGERAAAKAARDKAIERDLGETEDLWRTDPEAAQARQDEQLGPAVRDLPKIIEESSVGGKGVSFERVELYGLWECTVTGAGGQVTLQFETERTKGFPFQGHFVFTPARGVPAREEIRGTWLRIVDLKKKLLLGLFLDGIKSGREFKLRIPFDRELGRDLVGKDTDVEFVARNVRLSKSSDF